MKTVKFKDLPEKVQTFLYENQHSLGYFHPENDIQLNWLHNISIWDKATDEERLAYAKWKYPIGTYYIAVLVDDIYMSGEKCISDSPPIADFVEPEGKVVEVGLGYVYSDKTGWAEIIEEPEKEDVEMNASIKRDVEQVLAEDSEPTFKAGEYVEGIYAGEGSYGEFWFTGGKTKDEGRFICEDKHGGLLFFTEIRKIDPDKIYRAIAKEIIGNARVHEFTSIEYITVESAESMLIEALKKGKGL